MGLEIRQELVERLQARVALPQYATEEEVIEKALDALDWMDQERQAVQEGIDAWQAGVVEDFDDFDRRFSKEHGISPDA